MLKCIIVSDQPQSTQLLKNYIKKVPFLTLLGTFPDSRSALVSQENNHAELILLDVSKAQQTRSLFNAFFRHDTMIILTSSNRRLALDGFDHGAIDFLMKPILLDRFHRAVEKAYKLKFAPSHAKSASQIIPLKGGYIFIKESTRLLRVELDDIYYVMGLKNYVSILTKTQRIVSLQTMKQMEELLPSHRFIRVHRSYFVALDKIISVEKQQIQVKDKVIPIGNAYLPSFMKRLTKRTNT
jgi:DNA-binding LytR/AlgR family response regulator